MYICWGGGSWRLKIALVPSTAPWTLQATLIPPNPPGHHQSPVDPTYSPIPPQMPPAPMIPLITSMDLACPSDSLPTPPPEAVATYDSQRAIGSCLLICVSDY